MIHLPAELVAVALEANLEALGEFLCLSHPKAVLSPGRCLIAPLKGELGQCLEGEPFQLRFRPGLLLLRSGVLGKYIRIVGCLGTR